MTKLIVIDPIHATHQGPEVPVPGSEGERQLVHLRQGDIDGACGPYCLFMALIICGVARRDEITGSPSILHGNKLLAKLFKSLADHGVLIRNGMDTNDLVKVMNATYVNRVTTEPCHERGVKLKEFVVRNVCNNYPVILASNHDDSHGHWVLVVGLEYTLDTNGSEYLSRMLVLDPGKPAPEVSAWNGVIDTIGAGGEYPYHRRDQNIKIKFTEGVALIPNRKP